MNIEAELMKMHQSNNILKRLNNYMTNMLDELPKLGE